MKKKNLSVKKKIHNFYYQKLDDPRIKRIYLNFKNLHAMIFLFILTIGFIYEWKKGALDWE